jgi:hypothetical protein
VDKNVAFLIFRKNRLDGDARLRLRRNKLVIGLNVRFNKLLRIIIVRVLVYDFLIVSKNKGVPVIV